MSAPAKPLPQISPAGITAIVPNFAASAATADAFRKHPASTLSCSIPNARAAPFGDGSTSLHPAGISRSDGGESEYPCPRRAAGTAPIDAA